MCPSSENFIRLLQVNAGGVLKYQDLTDFAQENRKRTPGHSYENFGWWGPNSSAVIKKESDVLTHIHKTAAFNLQNVVIGPANTWLQADADDDKGNGGDDHNDYPDPRIDHHSTGPIGGTVNFADGHAEFILQKDYLFRREYSFDENKTTP